MIDKDKIEKLKSFDEAKYENVDLDHLIMYVVGQLERIGADLSFENVVVAAFKLFPQKFSLLGFREYPDSNRVGKCLWRCAGKKKQWLGGKIHQGFIITERSKTFIKEATNLLEGLLIKKTQAHSQTRRKEVLLAEVMSSPAYIKYSRGQGDSITEADFCFLLQGTLDSLRETLKENLISLKKFTEELGRKDVLVFLNWLEHRFKNFLGG